MNRVIASEWLWRRSTGILTAPAGGLTGEHAPGCSLGVPGIRTCSPVD